MKPGQNDVLHIHLKMPNKKSPSHKLNGFILFRSEICRQAKELKRDMSAPDLSIEAGKLWHLLSRKEREAYNRQGREGLRTTTIIQTRTASDTPPDLTHLALPPMTPLSRGHSPASRPHASNAKLSAKQLEVWESMMAPFGSLYSAEVCINSICDRSFAHTLHVL